MLHLLETQSSLADCEDRMRKLAESSSCRFQLSDVGDNSFRLNRRHSLLSTLPIPESNLVFVQRPQDTLLVADVTSRQSLLFFGSAFSGGCLGVAAFLIILSVLGDNATRSGTYSLAGFLIFLFFAWFLPFYYAHRSWRQVILPSVLTQIANTTAIRTVGEV